MIRQMKPNIDHRHPYTRANTLRALMELKNMALNCHGDTFKTRQIERNIIRVEKWHQQMLDRWSRVWLGYDGKETLD